MSIEDGGPAFPIPLNEGQPYSGYGPCDGMTLRDYFAAKAIGAVYAEAMADARDGSGVFSDPHWRFGLALDAYMMADAMLKARQ